jgi:enoyl-CoA hydratase/carnithine racemase
VTTPDYGRYQTLLVRQETDGVAVLTLNRPERRNAVSRQMHDELEEVFVDLGNDVEIRGIVKVLRDHVNLALDSSMFLETITMGSEDLDEASRAFFEKRMPTFRGR